ncbi:hydroxysqualene dehydroxylase HpnE [Magnetovibrio blakemorei]|uniref:Amine oxidase domain-containing protein n=1 Tax=Magnetovibrio blakemorei TaxID=28181 RepID=A0A1E5Q693_9PROT|nr:hydroxysqualene dehydroxylase HpnE [Magnetovibrio blakemorei]OEJ65979.1 hypothetical protein BEN30_13360 [Magnetovibrio blakemorei]
MTRRVHIIGAGLAGLSAAVRLCAAGVSITVHETAKHAGGRCRSFYDDALEAIIDNGSHLVLSGNHDVLDYVALIGGQAALEGGAGAQFAFQDLSTRTSWCVDLGQGHGRAALLSWLWDKRRQPPGFTPWGFWRDLLALSRGRGCRVAACLDTTSELYRTFWRPMTLAVLNVEPQVGSAQLLWAVLRDTVLKGSAFANPVFAPQGLGAALVDPALAMLARHGADVHFGRRISGLECQDGRVSAIQFAHAAEVLGQDDGVVLAVPHHKVADVLEDVHVEMGAQSILNVHYRVASDEAAIVAPRLMGLVEAKAQWLLQRGPIVSVTVSDAQAWMDKDTDAIAHALWPDVAQALDLGEMPSRYRVIKERRATFCASPEAQLKRLPTRTKLANLVLAGDWTDTGLPATLESAVKSGRLAAETILA